MFDSNSEQTTVIIILTQFLIALQLHEKFIPSPTEQALIGWLSLTKVCGFLQMYNEGTNRASLPDSAFCLPLGIGKTASTQGSFRRSLAVLSCNFGRALQEQTLSYFSHEQAVLTCKVKLEASLQCLMFWWLLYWQLVHVAMFIRLYACGSPILDAFWFTCMSSKLGLK